MGTETNRPSNEQIPNDDFLRRYWRINGGDFHGPNVETGTMPEAKLLPLLRTLLDMGSPPEPAADQPICTTYVVPYGQTVFPTGRGSGSVVAMNDSPYVVELIVHNRSTVSLPAIGTLSRSP